MNTYVESMRQTLESFYNAAKASYEQARQAEQRYKPDVAAEEVKRLDEQLTEKKAAAINAITDAEARGIEAATHWGELDGSKINNADTALLQFDLTAEQLQKLVDRNKSNGTMCFILQQYADKQALKIAESPETNPFYYVKIPNVAEKIEAYKTMARAALTIVANITGYGWGRGVNGLGVESSVKTFGNPEQMNAELLEALEV